MSKDLTISVALTERIWLYNNTARARGSGFLALLLLAYKEEAHTPVDAWAFVVLYFVLRLIHSLCKAMEIKRLAITAVPRAVLTISRPNKRISSQITLIKRLSANSLRRYEVVRDD